MDNVRTSPTERSSLASDEFSDELLGMMLNGAFISRTENLSEDVVRVIYQRCLV